MKKQEPTTCCLQRTNFKYKDEKRLGIKGQKIIYDGNTNHKKVGVGILISGMLPMIKGDITVTELSTH